MRYYTRSDWSIEVTKPMLYCTGKRMVSDVAEQNTTEKKNKQLPHSSHEISVTRISFYLTHTWKFPMKNQDRKLVAVDRLIFSSMVKVWHMHRFLLGQLRSESTDFNFALAKYGSSRRMSCFGGLQETISYVNNEYRHGGIGRNRLKRALSKMILKQFEKRRGDRKTDTAKVRFTFCIFRV